MKNYIYFLAFISLISITSCSTSANLVTLKNGKKIDPQLVGVWTGTEQDKQLEGVTKNWEMSRTEDGSFILNFDLNKSGDHYTSQETGTWWIENGKFFEHHKESNLTDVYEYKILNKNQVRFKAEKISVDMNSDSYEFTDTRKMTEDNRRGSSYETAIKVNSVREEYEYVRQNCVDCKMKLQSLMHKNGNPYDVLTLEKPDGSEIKYYFNIKSFFGKFLN